jgi:phytoene dehydrogenase-like protein
MGVGSPFFRTLPLERHGLEWIFPPVEVAHPLEDGRAAALVRSVEETAASFGPDGPAYRRLFEPLARQWPALAEEVLQPMLHVPRHPFLLARFGLEALQSAQFLARRHFKTDTARALMAGFAAHSFLPLDAPLSASFCLLFGAVGHAVGWPLPRGGSQRISEALASHLRELGGTIETGSPLASLDELPDSRPALLDLSAWNLAALPGRRLPEKMRGKLRRLRHGAAVFKIDYALHAPVPWKAEACRRAGTVHLGGTLEEVAASEHAMSRGEISEKPFILFAQQSLFDPTRAPAGFQTGWAYCHVPLGCSIDMTERMERQIERFAPGFRDCIRARHLTTPAGFEAHNANLVAGDISGGASDALSLLARPSLSFNPYRLAPKLYLCSSSTPPGGGVHGMCGYHAARAALRD